MAIESGDPYAIGGFRFMEHKRPQASELYDSMVVDARAGRSGASFVALLQLSHLIVPVSPPTVPARPNLAIVTALADHWRVRQATADLDALYRRC